MERNPIRYGVYGALLVTITMLLTYFINGQWVFTIYPYISWAIYGYFMYQAAVDDRKDNGGFISFKEAFTSAFVVYAVASLAYPLTYYLLESFLAPELYQMKLDIAIESTVQALEAFGQSDSEIDKVVEAIEESTKPQGLAETALVYLVGFIFLWWVPMLIIASAVKKEGNPNINVDDTEHFVES